MGWAALWEGEGGRHRWGWEALRYYGREREREGEAPVGGGGGGVGGVASLREGEDGELGWRLRNWGIGEAGEAGRVWRCWVIGLRSLMAEW